MNKNTKLNIEEIKAKKTKLKSYPVKFYIESTQKCNLKCIMCDRHIFSSEEKEFPLELFEKIKPLMKKAEEVNFYYFGEPLLSKNLKKFLVETKKYSFLPKIFTNGAILNDDLLNLLDECGVFVNISLEATTKNIYETIRDGASFEIFMDNLKRYAEKYKHRTNDRFHIRLSCAIAIDHISEILNIIELAKKFGIRDVFLGAINLGEKSNRHLVCDEKKTAFYFKKGKELADKYKIRFSCPAKIGDTIIKKNNNWNDFSLPIDKYVSKTAECAEAFNPNPITEDCGYPWIQTVIRANGDVCSCCQGRYVMGNLYKNSFDEIWNGRRYHEMRAQKSFKYCMGKKCNIMCYSIWGDQISR